MERTTIDQLLAESRSRIVRLSPEELVEEQDQGANVIDTRDVDDRRNEGFIPGSIPVPLSVLPWRLDPSSPYSQDRISDLDDRLVVVCNDGFSSSIAAAMLVDLGFDEVADLRCGFRAWLDAGFPIDSY